MKRSERVDAAPSEATPDAGSWTQTATDKILPLAQTAAAKAGPLAQTAAAAAAPLATQAVAAVSPYAHTVADRVGPYADKAAERLAPLAAGGALAAHQAAERVAPVLSEAYGKVAEAYGKLSEAYEQVGPALESAREHVTDELLPKVTTALGTAAASPIAVEAVKRGRATVAAARGELSLPEPQKSGSWVKRVAVLAAVAGAVTLVARQLLGGSKDSGWQAARPSAPTAPSTTSAASAGATATTETGTGAAADDRYGEGAYVGEQPPEGYVIKGDEDSMKYHLPDGSGYFATQAEVWFNSEEAAERAGFVRAQE